MNASVSFGQWLKQRRKALELTREALAQRIGCAVVTLNKIEADERRPSHQLAELLAEHLNIPLNERQAFISFARAKAGKDGALENPLFHSPTNLPAPPNLLIGRTADVAALRKQLLQPQTRLLTLTGPPGIGKTRLALQLAAKVREDFPDGVFLVSLAPVTDATLVFTTCASTLGVPEGGPQTPLERLKTFLREKQILLVLDNFEQVLAAAAQIADLLAACPWLKLLVTSRAPLRIRPERQFPVTPLALPDLIQLPDADTVSQYSAVALFLERAQAVTPEFALTEANAETVVAICARLDGLPLAIELISARIKLLHPAQLLERLSGGLMLRSDGPRDLEPRHRTLNAAIEWSYHLLSADEQTLFRRLGVFVGGWTLEAAEAVYADNRSLNVIDGLASLLDKSLIKQEAMPNDSSRFMMLETIREFALEQLNTHDELEQTRRRHAEYFVTWAETPERPWIGSRQHLWWDQLEVELANFRAALTWSRTKTNAELELRLNLVLAPFWHRRNYLAEGTDWLTHAEVRSEEALASEHYVPADKRRRAWIVSWSALFETFQGNVAAQKPRYEECLRLFRELGDNFGISSVLGDYGMHLNLLGDNEQATAVLEECLVLRRQLGDISEISWCLFFLGIVAYSEKNIDKARAFWEEGLEGMRASEDMWGMIHMLSNLALAALDRSDIERAETYLTESLIRAQELGDLRSTAHTLEGFARAAVKRGELSPEVDLIWLRGARLFGAAEKFREGIAAPILPDQQPSHEQCVAYLRAQLDVVTLSAAWTEGRAMTTSQVIAYALTGLYTAGEAEASSE